MKTAYSYARVSTKEQEEKKNSIPEQFRRIQKFANENCLTITHQFQDSSSAFHDETREQFNNMIELALKEKPDYIIFDDSSRFARTKQVATKTKKLLRSHGINILYSSEPNIDTNTVSGFWYEGIQELKNEATSREIAFHTFKGMSGNIGHRDIETGWCYKNGGKAPYGYKRSLLYRGENKQGKPIYKTIWEIDENTYEIVRKIIVDMYTNKEMSYDAIRDFLNSNNIKNSNGGFWSTSTIYSMLTKDRLEEYAGIAIWNKSNNKVIGVKYNSRDKWIICENAHPAIITKEELERALEYKERVKKHPYTYKSISEYLLTGRNIEDNFLFTCSKCGGHIVGSSISKKHKKSYCCSNNRAKGNCACTNNYKVDKDWLEDRILDIIEENYICDKNIDSSIDLIYKKLSSLNNSFSLQISNIQMQINKIDNQMQNLLNAIKNNLNTELAITEINNLKIEYDKKTKELKHLKNSANSTPRIAREDVKKYFYDIKELFYNSTIQEKRELLKTFIYSISLNSNHQLEIITCFQWCKPLEQVMGIEPT